MQKKKHLIKQEILNSKEECKKIVSKNENINKLQERNAIYMLGKTEEKQEVEEKTVVENKDVTQGKVVIGLDILFNGEDIKDNNLRYKAMIYNSILGGSANSKLFQNVREKASLAYVASSMYVRYKSNIFILAGIEIENFEKAIDIIKKQLEDMKNGDFTEEDLENAKKGIISQINTIDDEQDTQIIYFFGQEITNSNVGIEEYKNNILNVTKEDVIKIASKIKINTIYFLRN